MKIDNQRVTGKDLIEGYNLSQTRIISFSTEEQTDIFGIKTSDIPKTKNAIVNIENQLEKYLIENTTLFPYFYGLNKTQNLHGIIS